MRHAAVAILAVVGVTLWGVPAPGSDDRVVDTVHNLSVSGPGAVRALTEDRVCIFCHAPHNTDPQTPLWNRSSPQTHYRIYQSSTTHARIDQPGGSSKMCLSCHDGSIALGMVLSEQDPIAMNQTFMPSGRSNMTNDLTDDHPIGFRYDRQLSNHDPELRSPDQVSHKIDLGPRGEVECVSCHDPHNNEIGDFLRVTTEQGSLCLTCHQMAGWPLAAHALVPWPIPRAATNGRQLPFTNLRDAACNACHSSHNANVPERLLNGRSFQLCMSCHNGLFGSDMASVLNSRSGHRVMRLFEFHDPAENFLVKIPHVDCVDCHNPHAAQINPIARSAINAVPGRAPVPPAMFFTKGVTLVGAPILPSIFYDQVCLRCHGDIPAPVPGRIIRQRDSTGNIRTQLLPTTASAHPITFTSRLSPVDVPSLKPEYRTPQAIGCQDCHNNPDSKEFGGVGPSGPHGSRFDFLLVNNYETADYTSESPQAYALCYQCHERSSILGNQSFPYHSQHVVNGRTPCSSCHAPHGVTGSPTRHSHLINFDLAIVGGERLYQDRGRFSGSCTLTCHGVRHINFSY